MIEIKNISKSYDKKKVLKNISFNIEKNAIYGLLGPNGAGKTTLISILSGVIKSSEGTVLVDGEEFTLNSREVKKRLSLIPQEYAFYPTLTVLENLEFFASIRGIEGSEFEQNLAYALKVTGLEDFLDATSDALSGGLKRRLNIAIGLISDPEILFFDEPTVGIDPQSRNFILDAVKKLKSEDKIIIYTSHHMNEVEYLCDKLVIIDNGEVLAQGDLETLKREHIGQKSVEIVFKEELSFKMDGIRQSEKNKIEIEDISSKELSQLLSTMEKDGVVVESVQYNHHTIEDIFLKLTGKGLRDV